MKRRLMFLWFFLAALVFTAPLRATHPVPADENLLCEVDGNTVKLSWNIVFIAPIEGWVISRDGVGIVRLPPEANGYADENVPDGEHVYGLTAINFTGEALAIGRCSIVVGNFGLRCRADGFDVHLEWGPILIDVFISAFIIRRDGAIIASVPADVLEFKETVPEAGTYRYTVHAESSPGHEFLIGACTLVVPGTGFVCDVDPPNVLIDWSRVPLPRVVIDFFVIVRDGAIIARTNATRFLDQPGAGEHRYAVYAIFGLGTDPANSIRNIDDNIDDIDEIHRFFVGECTIFMPDTGLPPPQDFQCVVLGLAVQSADPANLPDPVIDPPIPVPVPVVRLTWANPVRYLVLVLLRDNAGLTRLPGSAMVYHDINPPAGHHVYTLWGIAANGNESRRVRCEVDVPPAIVPPVADLTCAAIQNSAGTAGVGVLRWTNPVDNYDAIIILRGGSLLVTLPGDATSYFDRGLGPDVYHYAVIAVIARQRSAPAECRIVIGGPQPRNLLFFSSGVFEPVATADEIPVPIGGDGRITCLGSNADPVQGWSFGVCSDPSVLVVAGVSIEATVTETFNNGEGPDFLSINRFREGVTMAVVIDLEDPADTLAPAGTNKLFHIRYEAGPDAVPGGSYPVRYCEVLGDPPVSVLYVVRGFEVVPETLPGWVRLPVVFPLFILRGDVNGDREVHMSDAIALLNWLFLGGRTPRCLEQADINGSSEVNLADAVYELQWEFLGGPEPPAPFPNCGPDDARLGCETPTCPQPVL